MSQGLSTCVLRLPLATIVLEIANQLLSTNDWAGPWDKVFTGLRRSNVGNTTCLFIGVDSTAMVGQREPCESRHFPRTVS